MKRRNIYLSEVSELSKIPLAGNDALIYGLNLSNRQSIYDALLSYATNEEFLKIALENSKIKALFVTSELYSLLNKEDREKVSFFIVENPEISFYELHEKLAAETNFYDEFSFASQQGLNCRIHPSAVIEEGTILGNNVIIGPCSVVRRGSVIGDDCRIGACSVIGSEGFQAIYMQGKVPRAITHVGGTKLGKNVHIGDNSTVGNALFEGFTTIGDNTIVDNHVHIAHNLSIGSNAVLTASVVLMGSSVIEDSTWLSPNAVVLNRKTVRQGGMVGSLSLVARDVQENTTVAGIPAMKIR